MANRSDIVRGMGLGMDIIDKLARAIVDAGGHEDEDLHFLATPQAQAALAKIGGVIVDARSKYYLKEVVVERRINIQEAIALGKYDEVDQRIEQLFELLISGDVIRETVTISPLCVYYQVPIGDAQGTREILKKRGYRPACLDEFLAFCAAEHEHALGLTFCLGTVAGPPDTGLVCYIDSDWDHWDEAQHRWIHKRCLKLVEGNLILDKQRETDHRENGKDHRHFVLAVRE